MTKNKKENVKQPEQSVETEKTIPADIPEKFKDAQTGDVNVEALLKSYRELERKLGTMGQNQDEKKQLPDSYEDYQIEINSDFIKNDPEINQRLFELGFTNNQVQAVYDLAVEKIVPVLEELSVSYQSGKDLSDLEQEFGGPERFNAVARQISAWGEKNLNAHLFETLAGSKEGIRALYKMMCGSCESGVMPKNDTPNHYDTEEELKRLMQSPKYWKHQDPVLVKRIEDGFKRLYG